MTGRLGTALSYLSDIELGSPGAANDTGSMSDTMTFSDGFTLSHTSNVTLSDTLTLSDSMAADGVSVDFTSRMGIYLSMLGNIELGYAVSLDPGLTDVVTFTDSFTQNHVSKLTLSDTIVFLDTLTLSHETFLTLSDSLTLSDVFPALMADVVTFSDSFVANNLIFVGWTDTLTFSESIPENHNSNEIFGDNMTVFDRFTFNQVQLLSWSDTIVFSDTMTGYLVEQLDDTLTFSDTLTYFKAHNLVPDILTFGDFFVLNQVTYWSMTDQLVLFEHNPFVPGMYYILQLADTLTLTDEFVGFAVHPIHDTLVFSDTIAGVAADALSDTLVFSDTIKASHVTNASFRDIVAFSDRTNASLVYNLSLGDGMNFLDNSQIAYIWHASASDSFSFSEVLVREIFEVIIDDSCVFSDTLTHMKIGSGDLADSFVFSDTLGYHAVTKHDPDDFLVLNDGFAVRVRGTFNGNPGIYPSLPISPAPPYQPPSIPVGVSNITRAVTIIGLGNTIILPPPEFNDYVSNQSKTIMQRSMTGMFRSYVKKTARQKLNWRFIIPKYKRDELYAFVLAEINNNLTIIDWEGNVWNTQLFSDTIDFVESGRWGGPIAAGDKNEVTLEFTGTKYV